jgi:hypothetical protein
VGGVPDAHLGSKFFWWHPMCHKVVARSETRPLEYIVQYEQYRKYDDQYIDEVRTAGSTCNPMAYISAEAEDEVNDGASSQSYCQMPAGVGAVGYEAVDELGHSIDEPDKGENDTETGIGDAELFTEFRHCERPVLPDNIENEHSQASNR